MNDQAINYQTSWLLTEATGRSHITDALEALRREHVIEGQRVVELGSGIGTNLVVFASTNSVLGVEGLESAVQESCRRGIKTVQADLEEPLGHIASESVDWVLCLDVLEHLVNPQRCLESARTMLRAGGHLIVNVPNHFDWKGRVRILRGSGIDSQHYFADSPHWAYPHLRFFSRRSIEALLVASGFELSCDLAPRFLSFPKARIWKSLGLDAWLESAQSRWPDLFSAGFFLVCRKA